MSQTIFDKLGLDEFQQEAVDFHEGSMLLVSGPGSGKTRVICHRIASLIRGGAEPDSILAVTFSRNAAEEMVRRVSGLTNIQADMLKWVCTFHSLGAKILLQSKWALNRKLADRPIQPSYTRVLLKQCCSKFGIKYAMARSFISLCKRKDMGPVDVEMKLNSDPESFLEWMSGDSPISTLISIFQAYESAKIEAGVFDFDDLVFLAWRLLRDDPRVLAKFQGRFKFVLIDEFHDVDIIQMRLAAMVSAPENNLFAVADPNQCQPPGELLLMDDNTWKPLGEARDGERVISWNPRYQTVCRQGHGKKIKVVRRPYNGKMFLTEVGIGEGTKFAQVRTTPEHQFHVKFSPVASQYYCCYLAWHQMYGFRVSVSQVTKVKRGILSLDFLRYHHVSPEKVWLLATSRKYLTVAQHMAYVSSWYGIPSVDWRYSIGANPRLLDAGATALHEHVLDFNHPLWKPGLRVKDFFKTAAMNLRAEVMQLPVMDGTLATVLSKQVSDYEGDVISLDVQDDHTYVTNGGIVVGNSIYGFRGASPEIAMDFGTWYPNHKKIFLGKNYRSLEPVVDLYKNIIHGAPTVVPGFLESISSVRGGGPVPTFHIFPKEEDESSFVAGEVASYLHEGKSAAILYRSNWQSRALESELQARGIEYVIQGSSSFFLRPEIKGALAFLRLVENLNDTESLKEAIGSRANVTKYLGKTYADRVTDYGSLSHVGTENQRKLGSQFQRFLEEMQVHCMWLSPAAALEWIMLRTAMLAELQNEEELDESGDNSIQENLRELVKAAAKFTTRTAFLQYVNRLVEATKVNEGSKNPVRLMTVHRSKGLEYDVVFLVGANEGILPHKNASDVDEERRIAYVAISRAKDLLYVSAYGLPSRFFKW